MKQFKFASRRAPAFIMAGLIQIALSIPAVAQTGQMEGMGNMPGMQNMPGMAMPGKPAKNSQLSKPKKKVSPRTIPKNRPREKRIAVPADRSQKAMSGMDHSNMPGMIENAPPRSPSASKPQTGDGKGLNGAPATMHGMNHEQVRSSTEKPSTSASSPPIVMEPMQHAAHTAPDIAENTNGPKATQGAPLESMDGMKMGPMQGGLPPPDARDPNAYADGAQRTSMRGMEMADDALFGRLLVNEMEYAHSSHERGQTIDAEAWYGGDYNKVWFKTEAERQDGRLMGVRAELLWDRVFATHWSTQAGIRRDTGDGPGRTWLAAGVRGMAPYWFETEATAYLGSGGALAARLEARYELLFTQRLILQPKLEANVYSEDDTERGIGSGLSDLNLGLRLRYEIRRQFAPYVGVAWKRKFGNTADLARREGERIKNTELVAGVRLWF